MNDKEQAIAAIPKLAAALEKATILCQHDKVQAWDIPEGIAQCPDCEGFGGPIPDPQWDRLREVLRIACWCRVRGHAGTIGKKALFKHAVCGGSGYVLRNWSQMPEGALEGALGQAFRLMGPAWYARYTHELSLDIDLWYQGHVDEAAAKAATQVIEETIKEVGT